MKKTPWFPADVLPVRNGPYECKRLENGYVRVTRMLCWDSKNAPRGRSYTNDGVTPHVEPNTPAVLIESDGDKWRGLQGDEHSLQIGASTYLVEFGDEGPDRPGGDE